MRLVDRLPVRLRWTPHNIISHPLWEVLNLIGARRLASLVHDCTVPTEWEGERRD